MALVRSLGDSNHAYPVTGAITYMYLKPFRPWEVPDVVSMSESTDEELDAAFFEASPLNDLPTVSAVRQLLLAVAPTLQRLIIDMPLRSLYPEQDQKQVRPLLREGFSALGALEEFTSVCDELALGTTLTWLSETPVWATQWPKLRCLALYNPDLSIAFWSSLVRLPNLREVTLSRADGLMLDDLTDDLGLPVGVDIKQAWRDALDSNNGKDGQNKFGDISITFVDIEELSPVFDRYQQNWQALDPENHVIIRIKEVPWAIDAFYDIERVQDFVAKKALSGELFTS